MPVANVLIVDDSMSARFALTRSLKPHGFTLETAKSAEDALECVSQKHFDLIFMDHVLPGMSGLDATEKIRAMTQYADTPIIMCSSNDGPDYVQEALQRGATDVIVKPPQISALNRVVSSYLTADTQTDTTHQVTPTEETADMSDTDKLAALDQRIDKVEKLLERLETTVADMDKRTAAVARAVADRAGKDLANRLLRAVITLKGGQ